MAQQAPPRSLHDRDATLTQPADARPTTSGSDGSSFDPEKTAGGDDRSVSAASVASKSWGVIKSEASARVMSKQYIWGIFCFIALAAFVVSLDQYTSTTYETQAVSTTFGQHSLIATLNVVQAIMQSVSQPPFAKFCDLVGRWEAYLLAVALYSLGYIITATSQNIGTYAGGQVIYTLGITGFWLINQIIIADNSSTRTRLFWSIFPSIPGIINVWLSGDVSQAIIQNGNLGWRFGFALFTFLVPILLAPVILALAWAQRRARFGGHLNNVQSPWKAKGASKTLLVDVWWQIDVVGLFLMVVGYGLLLLPITLARTAKDRWQSDFVPGMMVPGGICLIAFFVWEAKFAKHPILPFYLLKTRSIIFGFLIALVHPMAGAIQSNYLFTWFRVAGGQTIKSATRINGAGGSAGTIVAVLVGLLVIKVKRIKYFIVIGAILETLGFALQIRYRGPSNTAGELAGIQILKGIAVGLISFPTQAAVQHACKHEHVALVTASWLALFYIAQAIGAAVAGAIWSAELPDRLLSAVNGNATLANQIYRDPITWIQNPANTFENPLRVAVATAYSDAQRFLLITASAIGGAIIIFSLLLDNPRLGDSITLSEVEGSDRVVVPATDTAPLTMMHPQHLQKEMSETEKPSQSSNEDLHERERHL